MSATLATLPKRVRRAIQPYDDEQPPIIDAIGVEIAKKRDEAKAARSSSGIEATWNACEEAYLSIDDANRHEFVDAKWAKPMSVDGPVTTGKRPPANDHKSTVFLPLTARYVDAGVAKITEIILPADDKAFSFNEMPVPELIAASEDDTQVVHSETGVPLTRPAQPGEPIPAQPPPAAPPGAAPVAAAAPPGMAPAGAPPMAGQPVPTPAVPGAQPPAGPSSPPGAVGGVPAAPPRVPLTVADLAREAIEMARKKAKAAETRVYGWMEETKYRGEYRKLIFDAARIGVGVLKAPTPKSKRVMAVLEQKDTGGKTTGVELIIKNKIVPAGVWVDAWNIFPDPACGENIHDGDYIFERDFMSGRGVRALKKLPGYIPAQIDKVLEEGPNKAGSETSGRGPGAKKTKGRYEVWYFTGTLTKDQMAAIDMAAGNPPYDGPPGEISAIVTLINDTVVRATINPLDSGDFNYHSMPWQRRAGHWAGVGVAEQIRTPQKVTNAALRALLNNAGLTAGCQIIIDRASLYPVDGSWTVTPNKLWATTPDGAGKDVRTMFAAVEFPNVIQEMTNIITLGERFAEETSSIPLIAQGQSGATTPDTFGAAQLQNNNANQLLRSIGYAFDDFITEPVVRQYYEWLLLDPDVPNEEKGEFQIDAHGSIALVERAIQDQTIAQLGQAVANPAYGGNPKKWFRQMLRSKHLTPDDFTFTPEEQAKIDATAPAPAPAVQAAQIAADANIKIAELSAQGAAGSIQSAERIEQASNVLEGGRIQNEAHKTAVDATVSLHELELRHQTALLEHATKQNMSLNQAKAHLAGTAMTLQTQQALNAADNQADLAKHLTPPRPARPPRGMKPPGQVPGRAGNGRAFEQGPE